MKIYFKKSLVEEFESMEKATWTQAGKHLETRTDKKGHLVKRWISNGDKQPSKKYPGMKRGEEKEFDRDQRDKTGSSHAEGDIVLAKMKDGMVNGKVTNVNRNGVTVEDKNGNKNIVGHNDISRVLAKVNDNDAIRNLYDAKHIAGGWRNGDKGMQPTPDMAELWKACQDAQASFSNYSESVKERFKDLNPILLKRTSLKDPARAKEKLWEDEKQARQFGKIGTIVEGEGPTDPNSKYNAETLRDIDGHTFCVETVEDVSKMLNYFNQDKNVIRIKNNFSNPSSLGYSDINMNIRLPNGTIAEIQLNTAANMIAKEGYGHSLYEVYRSISSDPKYKKLADLMTLGQRKLYGMSNELSKNGKFPTDVPEGAEFFKYQYKPYADAIRAEVRAALPDIELAHNEGKINDKTYKHVQELLKKL